MRVDYAFLAEGAESVNGKIYIVGGGFDTIWTEKVPIIYPKLSFVLKIIFDAAEIGRSHKLEIQIIDEDGGNVATVGGDLTIHKKSPDLPKGWEQGITSVLNFVNLKFSKIGSYSFNIVVNNSSLKSIPLRIAQRVAIQPKDKNNE